MFSKNLNIIKISLVSLSLMFCFVSCFDEANPDEIIGGTGRVPALFSFEPDTAGPGQQITITGENLADATSISFNGKEATIVSSTNNSAVAIVPEGTTTGPISITTSGGTGIFRESFTIFIDGAPIIETITPNSAKVGDVITLEGSLMNAISNIEIGGVAVTNLEVAPNSVSFELSEETPFGISPIQITSSVGVTATDVTEKPFFVYEILDSLAETFDANENLLSHGSDAEVAFSGFNNELDADAPFKPNPIDNNFYYIGGTSDTSDSGSFIGLIGSSQTASDFYADFFNDENSQDITNVYFNMDVHFGDVPVGYNDVLGGIRMRFDSYDLDGDGSSSDEFMEYRPDFDDLAQKGFEPNADGWYSISIRMDQFLNSGPRGGVGSWDQYQLEDLTRIALVARRNYNDLFALSIDNVRITKGGPINTVE